MSRPAGVVVVGMACRYPDADSPSQLWDTAVSGRRAFRRLPPGRLSVADYGGDRDEPDRTYLRSAAVLEGWSFDRARFQVPGGLFRAADLSHWLALEVASDALADAGIPGGEGLDRSRVGVVIGNSLTGEFSRAGQLRLRWPYVRRAVDGVLARRGLAAGERADLLDEIETAFKAPFPAPGDETLSGSLSNTIAGRICNHFDFHGAGYTVDGACASSLLAVAHGCEALARGDLDLVLAGGVDLSLDPLELVGFARLGALAEGPMRIYDRRPTGFLPGEGCGVVALAREPVAAALGLSPLARLTGWGVSADGAGGLTRPEASGQGLALDRAHRRAGLDPDEVALVEGHGTGTAVGDRVELEALAGARRGHRSAALGSVKANIGHTKAAAGAAGLLKAVLALRDGVLPPTTGCETPHPLLEARPDRLRVLAEPERWPDGRRHAAVCSAGFGGVNVHVLLEGLGPAPRRALPPRARPNPDVEMLVLGAGDRAALHERLRKLARAAHGLSRAELADLAVTLARSLPSMPATHRLALVAATPEAFEQAVAGALELLAAGHDHHLDPDRGVFLGSGPPLRVGLLFSGQAAPVRDGTGMLGMLLGSAASARAVLPVPPAGGPPSTAVAQPAVVRASLMGLRWLRRLGVAASASLGHSLGELTALHWAGALDERTLLEVVGARAEAMHRLGAPGGMAAVDADAGQVARIVAGTRAEIAARNARDQVVVSGPLDDVGKVVERAREAGLRAVRLPVAGAFHSAAMAAPAAELRQRFASLPWKAPREMVVSSLTGAVLEPGTELARLLHDQLTQPVRFADGLTALARHADLLVEVGPGEVLTQLARRAGLPAVAMDAGAGSARGVATTTAALFAAASADASAWTGGRDARPFDLDRERAFLSNPCEAGAVNAAGGTVPAPRLARPAAPAAPTPPSGEAQDPLGVVVGLVAEAVELDRGVVRPELRLLGDLHLTSLRVAQLAVDAADRLGRSRPATPLSGGDASVAELAALVAALPASTESGGEPVNGVGPWVRAFVHELVPAPSPAGQGLPLVGERFAWRLLAPQEHPLKDELATAFTSGPGRPALLLALPPGPRDLPVDLVVEALRAAVAGGLPLVVLHHGGVGAAVARSLTAEHPELASLVIETEPTAEGVSWGAGAASRLADGHQELRQGPEGTALAPITRAYPLPTHRTGAIPLGAGDVCVVTGGAKGIGAECALALAGATGTHLVLLGRSAPADPEVITTLRRAADAGVTARYLRADVTDQAAVGAALEQARAELGPVRGLLHCAGRNEPARLEALTSERLRATLAPKLLGLEHLLAGVVVEDLRLLVTFGSVIGRIGLAGQGDYAVANEALAGRVEELAAELPGCRCRNLEWSVWSVVGMGRRLGVVDSLRRQGVEPIAPEVGVDAFLRLLADAHAPANVMVAGRLPASPALRPRPDGGLPLLRFLERPLVSTPGVELVADTALSAGADPYLADHVIDGVELLPAVIGLEAMAQAAAAVNGGAGWHPRRFENVRLARPVTVPHGGDRLVRVAALAGDGDRVECVLRSAESGFAVDHFRADVVAGPGAADPSSRALTDASRGEGVAAPHGYYGSLLFHGPRFARLLRYDLLSASRCVACVAGAPERPWFGGFHAQDLVLGDPGARDAFIHVLQACVPHRRVVPVAVDAIDVHQPPSAGDLVVRARERGAREGEYRFDVVIEDDRGQVCEEWRGLCLREIGSPLDHVPWPVELLAPYLARQARRLLGIPSLDVLARSEGPGASVEAARMLLGDAGVRHAQDGRLVAGRGAASASHLDGRLLVAAADRPIAVDWERGTATPAWEPVIGIHAAALVEQVAERAGEAAATAATRVWACREAVSKRGRGPDSAAMVVEAVDEHGWVTLRAGDVRLASLVTHVEGIDGPVAVAVAG